MCSSHRAIEDYENIRRGVIDKEPGIQNALQVVCPSHRKDSHSCGRGFLAENRLNHCDVVLAFHNTKRRTAWRRSARIQSDSFRVLTSEQFCSSELIGEQVTNPS